MSIADIIAAKKAKAAVDAEARIALLEKQEAEQDNIRNYTNAGYDTQDAGHVPLTLPAHQVEKPNEQPHISQGIAQAPDKQSVNVQREAAQPVPFVPLTVKEALAKYPRDSHPTTKEFKTHLPQLWNSWKLAERIDLTRLLEKREKDAAKALEDAAKADKEQQKDKPTESFALSITLNEKQQIAVDFAKSKKPFILTGAAGTGKTTACREIVRSYLDAGVSGDEIAIIAFTRRASANIREAICKDESIGVQVQERVMTIHALLEFMPEFFFNTETQKDSMRFVPRRHAGNLLTTKIIIIEEASMLGLPLWLQLYDALPEGVCIVFVGDINQLQPPFGKSIMNYTFAQLPCVELTEVYRQALDSGIIVNAHRILKGEAPVTNKDTQISYPKKLDESGHPLKIGQEQLVYALADTFKKIYLSGVYDPEQDIILSPWNKQPCGTNSLNSWIAQFLGEKREAIVYEVLAGMRKLYLAVGDHVMVEKQIGIVTKINHNGAYLGKTAQAAGTDLTRFGVLKIGEDATHEDVEAMMAGYKNFNLDQVNEEEVKRQASHVVYVQLEDTGEEIDLSSVGDFSEQSFSLGYALTVHKAQGCEWRNVYVVLHEDHTLGGFLSRELLYTACTRAKQRLILLAKETTLEKTVKRQEIKGNTLAEKIAFINSGANNTGEYKVTK